MESATFSDPEDILFLVNMPNLVLSARKKLFAKLCKIKRQAKY